ncbi:MAG: hypothetical protein D3910_03940, partial [Candidatus Electrothrix sp. ATG2]|nr:hypothetical protein [Candidatus Electrothrix sp. ATG2]
MYLQYFGLKHSPFTRQPDPDVFFAQAGRKNILKGLQQDFKRGSATMLVSGQEGVGKTVLCCLLRHRLNGSSCKVVRLENPIGSFDELLKDLLLKLGGTSGEQEGDRIIALHDLLGQQKAQGRRVVLLIDGAEKMFLAALERLFRLLGEIEQYGVQAILFGEPALNTAIEQLSGFCEDVRVASIYELHPFSLEEVGAYLAYRLKIVQSGKGRSKTVFSEEAVQKIFSLSNGVAGQIDRIAETSLENAAAEGEKTVLPAHVAALDAPVVSSVEVDDEEAGRKRIWLLLFLVLALLVFGLFGRTVDFVSFFFGQQAMQNEAVQEPLTVEPENTELSIAVPEEAPLPFVAEEAALDTPSTELSAPLQEKEESSLFSLPVPQRPDFIKKASGEADVLPA